MKKPFKLTRFQKFLSARKTKNKKQNSDYTEGDFDLLGNHDVEKDTVKRESEKEINPNEGMYAEDRNPYKDNSVNNNTDNAGNFSEEIKEIRKRKEEGVLLSSKEAAMLRAEEFEGEKKEEKEPVNESKLESFQEEVKRALEDLLAQEDDFTRVKMETSNIKKALDVLGIGRDNPVNKLNQAREDLRGKEDEYRKKLKEMVDAVVSEKRKDLKKNLSESGREAVVLKVALATENLIEAEDGSEITLLDYINRNEQKIIAKRKESLSFSEKSNFENVMSVLNEIKDSNYEGLSREENSSEKSNKVYKALGFFNKKTKGQVDKKMSRIGGSFNFSEALDRVDLIEKEFVIEKNTNVWKILSEHFGGNDQKTGKALNDFRNTAKAALTGYHEMSEQEAEDFIRWRYKNIKSKEAFKIEKGKIEFPNFYSLDRVRDFQDKEK